MQEAIGSSPIISTSFMFSFFCANGRVLLGEVNGVELSSGPYESGVSGQASGGVKPHDVGGVAQLGERLPCTQEAIGSTPFTSTTD